MGMHLSSLTVPVFVRGLQILSGLLKKGEAHASLTGIAPEKLLDSRLAEDMFPLLTQVQRACDACKFALQRIGDIDAPNFPDNETSFQELYGRIASTIKFLESIDLARVDAGADRKIVLSWGPQFTGTSYVLTFALPNFYFHLVTAYDILRQNGVNIGKLDYLGALEGHEHS